MFNKKFDKRLPTDKDNHKQLTRLAITTSDGFLIVDYENILYLESQSNYTTFYFTNNTKVTAAKNIGHYEKKLCPESFFRIHNSIIVNFSKVIRYVKEDGGKVIMSNKKSLPVSRKRRIALLQALRYLC